MAYCILRNDRTYTLHTYNPVDDALIREIASAEREDGESQGDVIARLLAEAGIDADEVDTQTL